MGTFWTLLFGLIGGTAAAVVMATAHQISGAATYALGRRLSKTFAIAFSLIALTGIMLTLIACVALSVEYLKAYNGSANWTVWGVTIYTAVVTQWLSFQNAGKAIGPEYLIQEHDGQAFLRVIRTTANLMVLSVVVMSLNQSYFDFWRWLPI